MGCRPSVTPTQRAGHPTADSARYVSTTPPAMNQPTENTDPMNFASRAVGHDMEQLVRDAGALFAATADVADEKVGEARQRLASALDRAREFYGHMRDKALAGSNAADVAVHDNLYQAIGIGIGAGIIIGYLFANRCSCKRM